MKYLDVYCVLEDSADGEIPVVFAFHEGRHGIYAKDNKGMTEMLE